MKEKAICLVSGGMDSLVCAAMAADQGLSLAFLHLNYGQKTQQKELECFRQIAGHYGVEESLTKVIDVTFLKEMGGSSLTDAAMEVQPHSPHAASIPSSYVPFRNTLIISMAVSWAEVIGATSIYIGAVEEDSSGYPDCRPSYYKAMNNLIKEGTKEGVVGVVTPVIHMSKGEIVQAAISLKAPLEHTWSCYQNDQVPCGVCDSCVLRQRGFEAAGVRDPLLKRGPL